jgi:osmotically-inducible protein OsmY
MNNDHELKTNVLAELAWEPSISADHIGVTAKEGVVTLSGHVDSYWQKQAAERAAGRVKGVKALAEEIEVRLPIHIKRNDEEIASAALGRLAWDSTFTKDSVKVKVDKGHVTLTGDVDWHFERDAATDAIRTLSGVTGIANQIKVKGRHQDSGIVHDIMKALHRSWYSDDNIKVSADGGRVHLTGTVETWDDRLTAAATAWAAPGTTSVVNDIRIT